MTLTQIKKAGLDELALDHVFTIGASGYSYYQFQGEGLNGTVNNPTLYLTRGKTYRFKNTTGSHAIRIQSADNGTSGTLYNTGVTNNNTTGTVIVEVQHDAPDVLYYQCANHSNMKGTLYITGALADGGVTTAKLAADAVTGAKIADDSITSAHLASNSVNTAELIDDGVTQAKIADNAIGTSQLANNAVYTAAIQNDAITSDKIANGTIGTADYGAASINTAAIQDDAVDASKLGSNAVVNASVASNAAIAGTKIAPNFGSQNIETTGNITCDGEFQPHWVGHQSQCSENTHNNVYYWKVAEVSGGGSQGGKIEFFGTTDYSGNGTSHQTARVTLIIRCLTQNQLGGIYWAESGGYQAVHDIRWKHISGTNYEIWIKKGAYDNVVPHITGSFDYVTTFGSSTGSGTAPSGSTAFYNRWNLQMGGDNRIIVKAGSGQGIILGGKQVFSTSGYSNMNVAYSFDVDCADDSGNGQFFYLVAGHTHYNHSYGAIRISHFCARGTSIVDTQNYTNLTSSNGGSWSVSKPSNTVFRITHNAGSYNYAGRYTVTLYCST